MKLVYLNYTLSSVFESQVLELLVHLKNTKYVEDIFLCCGYKNNNERIKIQELNSHFTTKILTFKVYPNYPFFNIINRHTLKKSLSHLLSNNSDLVLHIRGELAGYLITKTLKKTWFSVNQVLIDIRGAGKEEIQEFNEINPILKWLKVYNYDLALKSLVSYNNINAVSIYLKNYITERTNISYRNINVIPCFGGQLFNFRPDKRILLRDELGIALNNVLLIVSSGGTGQWQNNEAIIELANRGYKVLNLSRKNIPHSNVINKFVPYNQMSSYLQAADIAVIMRNKSIVNEVSSPVKFSEFICSGLPIITNRNIGVISDYIEKTGFGIITESLNDITQEDMQNLLTISRKEISEYGTANFGINNVAFRYYSLYRNMLKEE